MAFPNSPSVTAPLTQFEYIEMGTHYGVRVRGYVCAPVTGEYTFFISGDDQVELWLSTDDNPANKILLAYILSWTNPKQYDKFPSQKSAPAGADQDKEGAEPAVSIAHRALPLVDLLTAASKAKSDVMWK